jgi:phosphoribosylamine-glycine ligase
MSCRTVAVLVGATITVALAGCSGTLGSSSSSPTVKVTVAASSYPAKPPAARYAFIIGYNAAHGMRSLLGTELKSGDPASKATPTSLCVYEAAQTYGEAHPAAYNGYRDGCEAAMAGRPDTGS